MATTNVPTITTAQQDWLEDDDYLVETNDAESVASIDDGEELDHPPEKILAEFTAKNGHKWYLVNDCPEIPEKWKEEKQKQAEGKSTPLDIAAFNQAVVDVENAERQRRILRRF